MSLSLPSSSPTRHSSCPPPSSSPPSSPLSACSSIPGSPFFVSTHISGSSPDTRHSDLSTSLKGISSAEMTPPPMTPASMTKGLFYNPSTSPDPSRNARRQFIRERMSRKLVPYPPDPAPLEVHFAARLMGRERKPYVSGESLAKHAGHLENGLSQMRPSTLYKGYQAQLAARETARQRMLATAWEIEEAERFITFLNAMHADNEDRLKFTDAQLHSFRSLFSEHDCIEVDDDRDYLQAVYEDEREILKVISYQAEHVAKVLGSHVGNTFQSGVGASRFPSSQPEVIDDEDDGVSRASMKSGGSGSPTGSGALDDEDDPKYLGTCADYTASLGIRPDASCSAAIKCPPQRKGKAKIAKPPRGSGLNPSHEPADTQINLPDEQPQPPAQMSNFNPHQWQHHLDAHSQPSPSHSNPGHYLDSFSASCANPSYPDSSHYNYSSASYTNSLSGAGYTTHSQQDFATHSQQDFAAHSQHDFAAHSQQDFAHSQQDFAHSQQDFTHPQQDFAYAGPSAPSWVSDDEEFQALSVPPLDLQHLRPMSMGEISRSHVIHTTGPARTSKTCRRARRMPPTPRLVIPSVAPTTMGTAVAPAPAESAESPATGISPKTRKEAISVSKEHILSIIFSKDTLASLAADKKCIIKQVICDVRPGIPALLVATQWTANNKDVGNIWCTVTKFRTVFTMIIRQAVVMGYSLFPPHGCDVPPDTFRVDRVQHLVVDYPLAFMHQYSFTADGALVVHTKFNNPFILHVLTRLIWCSSYQLHTFLDASPRHQLRCAISVAGSITELVLMEQGMLQIALGRITPQMMFPTFEKINLNFSQLSDTEEAVLDEFTDNIVVYGHSQQHANVELSDFEFE
ncbi:hypothetical protein F4604DRAFT_1925850 [Suillus subluteus]|nr:hypothetical protein F4604DRAFT_1925850 [Suillus subluteus]